MYLFLDTSFQNYTCLRIPWDRFIHTLPLLHCQCMPTFNSHHQQMPTQHTLLCTHIGRPKDNTTNPLPLPLPSPHPKNRLPERKRLSSSWTNCEYRYRQLHPFSVIVYTKVWEVMWMFTKSHEWTVTHLRLPASESGKNLQDTHHCCQWRAVREEMGQGCLPYQVTANELKAVTWVNAVN